MVTDRRDAYSCMALGMVVVVFVVEDRPAGEGDTLPIPEGEVMTFIKTLPPGEVGPDMGEIYDKSMASMGYVPNYVRVFSHRPGLYRAWGDLLREVRGEMTARDYELATLASAVAMGSSYCSLAHGEKLLGLGSDEDEVKDIAVNLGMAAIDERERAIVAYAAKVARSASSVTGADVERLRAVGLDDAQVFDIAAAAAARCFFSKLLDSVGALPDSVYSDLPGGLAEDLAVGRPIEGSSE